MTRAIKYDNESSDNNGSDTRGWDEKGFTIYLSAPFTTGSGVFFFKNASMVALLFLLLTGCTSDNRPQNSWSHITSNMDKVHKGMSMEEVGLLLGSPSSFYDSPSDHKGQKIGSISWSYENHSKPAHTYREFLVIFSDQVVSATLFNVDG
ncbi:MAG: hypothetical protein KC944_22850 [Candidatus Omnitrophica bacterium]|nr:hypothetical protein [Candidatus Omnitrophota bacterium]